MPKPSQCEYELCYDTPKRHFFGHYFCSEHNKKLRKKFQDEEIYQVKKEMKKHLSPKTHKRDSLDSLS